MTTTPTTDIPQSKLERIRALLAKAESSEFPAEKESFLAAATNLMAKYGVEQAHLGAAAPGSDKPINRIIVVEDGAWGADRARLIYFIAEAMRCKSLLLGSDGTNKHRVHVFGYESDVERAEVMYTSLLLQMASELSRLQVPDGQRPRAYRRSWIVGYVEEVHSRVARAEARAAREAPVTSTGTSTALVLVDRAAVVRREFEAEYPSVRRRKTQVSGRGFSAGQEAGRRANIGGTGMGAGSRTALGR